MIIPLKKLLFHNRCGLISKLHLVECLESETSGTMSSGWCRFHPIFLSRLIISMAALRLLAMLKSQCMPLSLLHVKSKEKPSGGWTSEYRHLACVTGKFAANVLAGCEGGDIAELVGYEKLSKEHKKALRKRRSGGKASAEANEAAELQDRLDGY